MINPFFKNRGPFNIDKLLNSLSVKNENLTRLKVLILKILVKQKKMILLFFIQKNMKLLASKTKASFCITTEIFSKYFTY